MTSEYQIGEILLNYSSERALLDHFLSSHALRLEEDIEVAYGIYDEEELLVGCGCAAGSLLKCFAVDEALRGQNALGALLSQLFQNRFAAGYSDLFVITRPHNEKLFASCGMHVLARTDALVMLENLRDGPQRYADKVRVSLPGHGAAALPGAPLSLSPVTKPESPVPGARSDAAESVSAASRALSGTAVIGAVVMNCNPFTLGHRALVEYAAARCDLLYLFIVEENRSAFSAETRLALAKAATADLPQVHPVLSGPYMISSATFPTYFLKAGEDAAALQCDLDITLFAARIAPALNITIRFAGEEPLDATTARYNHAMRNILPQYGIRFREIPRITDGDTVISASRVRALLAEKGFCEEMRRMVPPATAEYLRRHF